jgi:hypothetical protein
VEFFYVCLTCNKVFLFFVFFFPVDSNVLGLWLCCLFVLVDSHARRNLGSY